MGAGQVCVDELRWNHADRVPRHVEPFQRPGKRGPLQCHRVDRVQPWSNAKVGMASISYIILRDNSMDGRRAAFAGIFFRGRLRIFKSCSVIRTYSGEVRHIGGRTDVKRKMAQLSYCAETS